MGQKFDKPCLFHLELTHQHANLNKTLTIITFKEIPQCIYLSEYCYTCNEIVPKLVNRVVKFVWG
jgi:hypothetical protein